MMGSEPYFQAQHWHLNKQAEKEPEEQKVNGINYGVTKG